MTLILPLPLSHYLLLGHKSVGASRKHGWISSLEVGPPIVAMKLHLLDESIVS